MKLYLDLCCFNRPFDDQSQLLVRLQTEAKLAVQDSVRSGDHTLIWSAILDLENANNPDSERKTAIDEWKLLAEVDVATTVPVEDLAITLAEVGLKAMDALHVASAIEAGAECFLTTDKQILRKLKSDNRIQVLDPVDFIRETEAVDE
ncbi:MAG: PIN domain-containing protein [Planctomycetaceae bacterium]